MATSNRIEALLAFHADDPDDPFVQFALALEYGKADRAEEALAWFVGLVRDHPDYVGSYYHLGRLHQKTGRADDAAAVYRAGIEVAGRLRDAHARSELQAALMELESPEGPDDD